MPDELPDPDSDAREELNQLLRRNDLEGAIARNLMLKAIEKGLVESMEGEVEHEVEKEARRGILAVFSREEIRDLTRDVLHDSWAHTTLGLVSTLCAHHLSEGEVAAILAGTGTLFIVIKRRTKHAQVTKQPSTRHPEHYDF